MVSQIFFYFQPTLIGCLAILLSYMLILDKSFWIVEGNIKKYSNEWIIFW